MHPYLTAKLAEAHRDELLQQAESARLAALACNGRRPVARRWMTAVACFGDNNHLLGANHARRLARP